MSIMGGAPTPALSCLSESSMPISYGEMGESYYIARLRPVVAAVDAKLTRLARGTPAGADMTSR
jgi:hypothetical protein